MSEYYIRRMEAAELKNFYKHIEMEFSDGEYAPYAVLYKQIRNGVQDGLVFCSGGCDLAYSICAASHSNGYVLISLLAVFEEYRGKGIGSAFMKALCEIYGHKQAILVEVERPELFQTSEELNSRRRRIEFYKKAGFYLISGIDYTIWDVPMHLMALPFTASKETINKEIGRIMYQIYLELMGKLFIHKMQLHTLSNSETINYPPKNNL